MATRTLEISFIGDASGATKAMGDVADAGGKLEAKVGGLSSSFSTFGAVAGGVLAGGALAKAPGVLLDAAKGAAEDAAATARLEQSLRNAGGAFDENLAKVNNAIDAGQKKAFTDDQVRDSFQSLLAATGDVNEALSRQQVAMDLSRGAGISLEQASRMVGKVNSENVEAFKRLGITIGEGATEAEALAAVQAKFAGQSDAYAKSTAGQFEVAKIRMAEVQEQIGTALLPVLVGLGEVLNKAVIPAMEFLASHMHELMPIFIGITAAVGVGLTMAFYAWATAANAAGVANLAAAAASALALAPYIAIAVAIAAVVAGIVVLIQHWDDLERKYPPLKTATDNVKDALGKVGDVITQDVVPAVQAAAEWFNEHIVPALRAVAEFIVQHVLPVLGDLIAKWFEIHEKVVMTIIPPLVAAIQTIADKTEDVAGWVGHWLNVLGSGFSDVLNMISGPVNTILGWLQSIIDKVGAVTGALGSIPGAGAVGGVLGGVGGFVGSIAGLEGQNISASQTPIPLGANGTSLTWDPNAQAWVYPWEVGQFTARRAEFENAGWVGGGNVTLNIQNAYMRDPAEANRTVTNALRAAGVA